MVTFRRGRNPRIIWVCAVACMVAIDQASKAYFSNALPLGGSVEVTHWFNLVHILNTGAAFSLLADAGGWQRTFFIAFSVMVVAPVSLVCLMTRTSQFERWVGAAVVAGGVGNLIDRIQTGAVVDFLDVHWKSLHWPAFNMADIYVVCALVAWTWFTVRSRGTPGTAPVIQVTNP